MTKTLALAFGLVLGTVAAAPAQQKDLTRPRPSSFGTNDSGAAGSGAAIPGGSSLSPMPGGTISMGAATQNASPRPSLGPSLGPDLRDSLSSGNSR